MRIERRKETKAICYTARGFYTAQMRKTSASHCNKLGPSVSKVRCEEAKLCQRRDSTKETNTATLRITSYGLQQTGKLFTNRYCV